MPRKMSLRNWKALSNAELAGRLARKMGMTRDLTPYKRPRGFSLQLAAAWLTGWKEMDRELNRDKELPYTVADFVRECAEENKRHGR